METNYMLKLEFYFLFSIPMLNNGIESFNVVIIGQYQCDIDIDHYYFIDVS